MTRTRIVVLAAALAALGVAVRGVVGHLTARRSPSPFPVSRAPSMDTPLARWHARIILRHLPLQSGLRILDAGCGPGRLTLPLASRVGPSGQVVALDLQPEMLKIVEDRAQEVGLHNVSTLQAGLGVGEFHVRDEFDLAVMSSVLGEVPRESRQEALREIYRALQPGGTLAIAEVVADPYYQRRSIVLQLVVGAGFRVSHVGRDPLGFTLLADRPPE
jgi:ubiquinone/menaquinone biosynthesis C-methylase UbiE